MFSILQIIIELKNLPNRISSQNQGIQENLKQRRKLAEYKRKIDNFK